MRSGLSQLDFNYTSPPGFDTCNSSRHCSRSSLKTMEKVLRRPPSARRSVVRLPIRTLAGGLAWAGAARKLALEGGEDKDEDGAAGHDADRHPRRRHAQRARRGMGMHKYKYSTVHTGKLSVRSN